MADSNYEICKRGAREWQIVYKLNQVWRNAITERMIIWLEFFFFVREAISFPQHSNQSEPKTIQPQTFTLNWHNRLSKKSHCTCKKLLRSSHQVHWFCEFWQMVERYRTVGHVQRIYAHRRISQTVREVSVLWRETAYASGGPPDKLFIVW